GVLFLVAENGERRWRSPGRRHPRKAGPDVPREDDDSAPAPRAAAGIRSVADRLDGSTRRVHDLKLPARKETDRTAVGRPERKSASVRRGERRDRAGRERLEPELSPRAEDGARAVRRERDRSRVV